jgi:hypothetical protein
MRLGQQSDIVAIRPAPSPSSPLTALDFHRYIFSFPARRKEMSEKVMLVLNDDQKKTWKDLTGDAFDVPARVAPKKDD